MFYLFKRYYPLLEESGDGTGGSGDGGAGDGTEGQQSDGSTEDIVLSLEEKKSVLNGTTSIEEIRKAKQAESASSSSDENTPDPNQQTEDFVPSSDWDFLKSDQNFKIPEGITKENEQELLQKAVKDKFGIKDAEQGNMHPLVKMVQDAVTANPNTTLNSLVENNTTGLLDVSKLSPDEMIKFDLEAKYGIYDPESNPDGISEDDIAERISKLDNIQKKELVKEIQMNVDSYNKKLLSDYEVKQQEIIENEYETILSTNKKALDELKVKFEKVDSIFGIKVKPEENKNIIDEFEKMLIPDKENNYIRPIDTLLSSDDLLFKMWFLAAKSGEEEIINLITKGKEDAKAGLMQKLGLTASKTGSIEFNENMTMEEKKNRLRNPNAV